MQIAAFRNPPKYRIQRIEAWNWNHKQKKKATFTPNFLLEPKSPHLKSKQTHKDLKEKINIRWFNRERTNPQ